MIFEEGRTKKWVRLLCRPGGMVVSTVWVLAELGESNFKRAGRTVPPDSPTFTRTLRLDKVNTRLEACGFLD